MKNQDILLLLKLLCLELGQRGSHSEEKSKVTEVSWTDWKNPAPDSRLATPADNQSAGQYSVRSLAAVTGISKSEVSSALQRCFQVGLAIRDKKTDHPKVNKKALLEFLIYGLRYIFPAKIGRLSRGISTTFSAPVLKKKLLSAGDSIYVWPDAEGNSKGQSIQPISQSVPFAVRQDPLLYELLSLLDAVRVGSARERHFAIEQLKHYFEDQHE